MYAEYKTAHCHPDDSPNGEHLSDDSHKNHHAKHHHSKIKPIVLSGPSGGGKSTLLKKLLEKYPDHFGFSVSHTTRHPRPGEKPGIDYHYINHEDFYRMKANGEFIESTEFSGNCYGTSKQAVDEVQQAGRICILDVDVQGVKNVKDLGIDAYFIFISPPSMEMLESRLRNRGTETEEKILARLATAQEAMDYAQQPDAYHCIVVNDKLEEACAHFESFLLPAIEALQKHAC